MKHVNFLMPVGQHRKETVVPEIQPTSHVPAAECPPTWAAWRGRTAGRNRQDDVWRSLSWLVPAPVIGLGALIWWLADPRAFEWFVGLGVYLPMLLHSVAPSVTMAAIAIYLLAYAALRYLILALVAMFRSIF